MNSEQACASGRSAESRIVPPRIDYGADEVTVTVIVRSVVGEPSARGIR